MPWAAMLPDLVQTPLLLLLLLLLRLVLVLQHWQLPLLPLEPLLLQALVRVQASAAHKQQGQSLQLQLRGWTVLWQCLLLLMLLLPVALDVAAALQQGAQPCWPVWVLLLLLVVLAAVVAAT